MIDTPDAILNTIADDLLLKIRRRPGQPVRLSSLEKSLKVNRNTVEEALALLASYDYRLKKRKETVTFVASPDALTATEITYKLKTRWLGLQVMAFNSIKSTNDIATQMAEQGAAEGTIVTAEKQTRGRGRFSRSWFSPAGTGIYLSIILRPEFPPENAPGISVMTAVALADVLSGYCPGEIRIKWPNDVLACGKKIAGILTELSAERNRINYVIVGVGINVNHGAGNFPEEIRRTATSLRRCLKRKVNRVELLQSFLVQFEKQYNSYRQHRLRKSLPRIRRYSSLIGQEVKVRSGRTVIEGKAVDINADGCLILERDGRRTTISAGEVTVIKH